MLWFDQQVQPSPFVHRLYYWLMLYTLGQYIVNVQRSTTSNGFLTIFTFWICYRAPTVWSENVHNRYFSIIRIDFIFGFYSHPSLIITSALIFTFVWLAANKIVVWQHSLEGCVCLHQCMATVWNFGHTLIVLSKQSERNYYHRSKVYSPFLLLPPANKVWDKVMFLHVSVCSRGVCLWRGSASRGRGSASRGVCLHRGLPLGGSASREGWVDAPRNQKSGQYASY